MGAYDDLLKGLPSNNNKPVSYDDLLAGLDQPQQVSQPEDSTAIERIQGGSLGGFIRSIAEPLTRGVERLQQSSQAAIPATQAAAMGVSEMDLENRIQNNGNFLPEGEGGTVGIIQDIAKSLTSAIGEPISQEKKMQKVDALKSEFDSVRNKRLGYQEEAQSLRPNVEGLTAFERGLANAPESFLPQLAMLPISLVSKNPTPNLAAAGFLSQGSAYTDSRDAGTSIDDARLNANLQGAIEVGTELPGMNVLSKIGGGKVGAKVADFIMKDVLGEQVATAGQDLSDFALNKREEDKTFSDYLAERPEAAAETLGTTLLSGGAMSGTAASLSKLGDNRKPKEENKQQQEAKDVNYDDLLASIEEVIPEGNVNEETTQNDVNAADEAALNLVEQEQGQSGQQLPDVSEQSGPSSERSSDDSITGDGGNRTTATNTKSKPVLSLKPKTLLGALRDAGGVALSEKLDVTGQEKGFAPGGYNQIFRKDSQQSLKGTIESGVLDDYLPHNMRLNTQLEQGLAYDSTEAYDYLSERIRNGDKVLPFDVEQEIAASEAFEAYAERSQGEFVSDDEINSLLREEGYAEQRNDAENKLYGQENINQLSENAKPESTNSDTVSNSGVQTGLEGRAATGTITSQAQNEVTREDRANGERPQTRPLVETIVKRRAAANQINKSKQFDTALTFAKQFMAGEEVSPRKFTNAAKQFKNDEPLAEAYRQLAELAKVPAKVSRETKTNTIQSFNDRIADAKSINQLQEIAREIQTDDSLSDAQVQTLDDVVSDKIDELYGDSEQLVDDDTDVAENASTVSEEENVDLLGDNTANQQAIRDAETEKDAKRNTGQDDADEFKLTGSDRAVDQAAASGARDLFDDTPRKAQSAASDQQKAADKIDDFGEKIGGARKDTYVKSLGDLMSEEIDSTQPFSKIWPEPNYQELINDGADPLAVGIARAYRDTIRSKPRKSYRLASWLKSVDAGRAAAYRALTDSNFVRLQTTTKGDMLSPEGQSAELYAAVGHDLSLKGLMLAQVSYSRLNGVDYEGGKKMWVVTTGSSATKFGRPYSDIARSETKEGAIEQFKKVYNKVKADGATSGGRSTKFEVYKNRFDKSAEPYYIGKKVGRNPIKIKGGFKTSNDAFVYISENQSELEEALKRKKATPSMRKESNDDRVGQDLRDGKDVTPELFSDTFGFRGVEFGNWVENTKRQKDLNDAFDGLMDMANVLGIPPKAISLNGELGLAFGARGKGGARPAAAHYEPDYVVINLTKKEGAGSLAHEWWHALDNYFGKTGGKKMATEDRYRLNDSVRKEMQEAYKGVVQALKGTGVYKRADKLDNRRSKAYWGTTREVTARSFEKYMINELADREVANDYLANIVSKEAWDDSDAANDTDDSTYPYPTEDEMQSVKAAYDNFFDVIEHKEADDGNVFLFSRSNQSDSLLTVDEVKKAIANDIYNHDIDIYPTMMDAPIHVQYQALSEGATGVEGFFDRRSNKVALILSNLSSVNRAVEVARHELIGHYGMENMLGKDLMHRLINRVLQAEKNGNKTIVDVAKQVDETQPGISERRRAKEIIAVMAERNYQNNIVRRVIDAIRRFLKDIGFIKSDVTDARIASLLRDTQEYLKETGRSLNAPAEEGVLSFSRKDNEFNAPEESKLDNVIYTLQDKNIDLKRTIQNIKKAGTEIADKWDAYLQEELYHGRTAKRTQDFIKRELEPLLNDMSDRGVSMEQLEQYLHARHAEEANKHIASINPDLPDGGSGMLTKDANEYLAKLNKEDAANLEALADRVDSITAQSRNILVSYGLESEETIKQWESKYKHYVPLHREDVEHGFSGGTGQGFSVKGSSSKRRTGSQRNVVDIIANIAQQRERNIIRGEKNRVSTALIGLAKLNPNKDVWKTDFVPTIKTVGKDNVVKEVPDPNYKNKDNVIVARVPDKKGDIKEISVVFNERDERAMRMAESLKNLDQDQVGKALSVVGKATRYFSSINTQYNPIFGVINLTRDTQGAVLNLTSTPIAGKQSEVVSHIPSALKGIYRDLRNDRKGKAINGKWSELFEEFQREGGQTGYRDQYRNASERAEALKAALDPEYWQKSFVGKIVTAGGAIAAPLQLTKEKLAKPVFDWLSDYNNALENATRLAAYKVAIDSGISKQRAASIAKNITVNFNRKGKVGRELGALYAFFNASIQGTARIAETLTGPKGKQIIGGGLLLGAIQAVMMEMAGYDEDEPPEFIKDRNIIIPIGYISGKEDYIAIPMPLGFNALPSFGRIATEQMIGGAKDASEVVTHLLDMLLDVTNPIGHAGLSMQTITPTVLDPFAALSENKDWTGKPIAREDFSSLNPTTGVSRAKDGASTPSTLIAEGINYLTGGNEYKPGAFSPSPDQIDYLIGQVAGGVGREALKADATYNALRTGEDLPPYKIPLVGRFYGDTDGKAAVSSRFYKNITEMNELERELKGRHAKKDGLKEFKENNPEYKLIPIANQSENIVRNLRKRKRMLVDRGASKDKVEKIDGKIADVMERLNTKIERLQAE